MFKPTFLYIKQHTVTGLLYFGKTTKNPEKYRGSGKYWLRHLKAHGNIVSTVWYCLYLDEETCLNTAILLSEINDIVASDCWANLIAEDGCCGAAKGHVNYFKPTAEQLAIISQRTKALWADPDFRAKMIQIQKDRFTPEVRAKYSETTRRVYTEERKKKHSEFMKGKRYGVALKGVSKPEGFGAKVSAGSKGKPKSEEHISKMKVPKNRVCRLFDRKEMSVNHFSRWLQIVMQEEV